MWVFSIDRTFSDYFLGKVEHEFLCTDFKTLFKNEEIFLNLSGFFEYFVSYLLHYFVVLIYFSPLTFDFFMYPLIFIPTLLVTFCYLCNVCLSFYLYRLYLSDYISFSSPSGSMSLIYSLFLFLVNLTFPYLV